ncbi:MAG: hypothetical protein E7236_09335 [Lachnospiraceae bacterium]|nr:hypothetical protein [Lachnospiraceae bacterium]
MTSVKELKNLNGLSNGIHKQWVWNTKADYYKSCDYLQKINYCIQDLNAEITNLTSPSMKEVVYIIVLIDWIREAVDNFPKLLKEELPPFSYIQQKKMDRLKRFFTAIRSFAVAHPLATDRHPDYGFDGDKICVDIKQKTSVVAKNYSCEGNWYHLGINGLTNNAKNIPSDFVMYIYSKRRDNMQFYKYIGVDFADLYYVAESYIEYLYAFAEYLSNQKRKDYTI